MFSFSLKPLIVGLLITELAHLWNSQYIFLIYGRNGRIQNQSDIFYKYRNMTWNILLCFNLKFSVWEIKISMNIQKYKQSKSLSFFVCPHIFKLCVRHRHVHNMKCHYAQKWIMKHIMCTPINTRLCTALNS